jgi:hypothetical protein
MLRLAFAITVTCLYTVFCIAQGSKQTSLPRIGEIKDYPATGLMTGCGNLYFFKAGAKMSDATYVFLAHGDGSNAWMNLDGRDVRLRQSKSTQGGSKKSRGYSYSYRQTRVNVVIKSFETSPGREPKNLLRSSTPS